MLIYIPLETGKHATLRGVDRKDLYFKQGGSRPLATDSTRKLEILGRDGDTLGVDRAQIGVLEQSHEIGLARALQRHDGVRLEPQVGLEVLRHLAHQTLKRELAAEELGPLLVAADLAQGDGAGSVRIEMGE